MVMQLNAEEQLVSLTDARKMLIPKRPDGKPVARNTVWRWATHGVHGVKLKIVHVGVSPMTSAKWLSEFYEAITAARMPAQAADRRITASEADLEAAGLL